MILFLALLSTSCTLPSVALAQSTPDTVAHPKVSAPALSADLRPEYLATLPILVRLSVENQSSSSQVFPDLSARAHLVFFEIVDARGKKVTYHNTAPKQEPTNSWTLQSRSRKQALLAIPQSQALKPGAYTLTIKVKYQDAQSEAVELTLPPYSFTVAPIHPVGGEIVFEPLGLERGGHQVAWLQQSSQGYDVYIQHASGTDPAGVLGDYHLAHLKKSAEPVLTLSRTSERWDRYVYWQRDARSVAYVQLQGQGQSTQPSLLQTPYPKIELIGQGATDTQGGLHIPIWVPAPSGASGELMVLSLRSGTERSYRSLSKYASKPEWVETGIDSGGNLRLVLPVNGNLDQYTIATPTKLPGAGTRLLKAAESPGAPIGARYSVLAADNGRPGGLALFALTEGAEEGTVSARWFALDGTQLALLPDTPTGPGIIEDMLPLGYNDYALLMRLPDDTLSLVQPGQPAVPVSKLTDPTLVAVGDTLWVRSFQDKGPVVSKKLR